MKTKGRFIYTSEDHFTIFAVAAPNKEAVITNFKQLGRNEYRHWVRHWDGPNVVSAEQEKAAQTGKMFEFIDLTTSNEAPDYSI